MNTLFDPVAVSMPDVQGGPDTRGVPIQRVGVRGVCYPLRLAMSAGQPQQIVAHWEMTVALPAKDKGTHMSRFIEVLEAWRETPMSPDGFCRMARAVCDRLGVESADLTASFPYFLEKAAPVSGLRSLMDYQVSWVAHASQGAPTRFSQQVQVPVTSLCPCSKAISEYGAHNQRSHVQVSLDYETPVAADLDVLIRGVEAQASSQLWGLLKREDEKFVTEQAYENPKFVEDLVRDVAVLLRRLPGVASYQVEAENFESIHNHSAYAMVNNRNER
ncbi:GTP cyclohydrolase FolE2 [Castellaniella sp.]|uniref:GTP cyclohydrolase FolE2 n=1 Tax=Castellaniella sp. TaxID=1955812 RepID=UPI003C71AD3A